MRKKIRTRRPRARKRENNDIIIAIILILVLFNVGSLTFKMINNKSDSATNRVSFIERIITLINPNKTEAIKDIITHEEYEDLESHESLVVSEDIIIDRLEEYESLIIIRDSLGGNNIENIPKPINIQKLKVDKNSNYILMYHTHGTEAFLVEDDELYHNNDINKNVVSIGKTMTTVLEANGHKVDHVEIMHDLPSYNKSYNRSISTVNKKKDEQENLKIFFDIHRDGVAKDATYKETFLKTARIDINGVSSATFSLVIGPETPNYDQVLSFAKYIKAVSDALYPNLCKGIIIKPYGKFNLYASDYSALFEMGSNLVTLEETNETAKLVGQILSLALDNIIE